MWSEDSGDAHRRRELLKTAVDANPFTSIVNKYYGSGKKLSQEDFDKIHTELAQLPELTELYKTLATAQPRFTGIFRYDPLSIAFMGKDGCFSDRTSMGAATAYERIFEGLTIDKIKILQTPEEIMVVAAHPSYLISSEAPPMRDEEPTVLFSSRMFEHNMTAYLQVEEYQMGMTITHGDTAFDVRPVSSLVTPGMELQYFRYVTQSEKQDA